MEPPTRPPAPPMPPEAASLYAQRPPAPPPVATPPPAAPPGAAPPAAPGWGTSAWGQAAFGQAPAGQEARILSVEPVRRTSPLLRPLISLVLVVAVVVGAAAAVGWARNWAATDDAARSAEVLGSSTVPTLAPTTTATFPADPEARFYLYELANAEELNSINSQLDAKVRELESIRPPSTADEAELLLDGLLADTREIHRLLRRVIELLENAPDSPSRTRFLAAARQLDSAYDELEAGLRDRDVDRLNRAQQLADQAMQTLFGPTGLLS